MYVAPEMVGSRKYVGPEGNSLNKYKKKNISTIKY